MTRNRFAAGAVIVTLTTLGAAGSADRPDKLSPSVVFDA